ncbi:MAG: DUF1736 domain-containing protein [Phycisphaeraceae bacterium]|nr:DUF1736 domain-containing protein [Phycisphaeraceae bacterium]
MRHMLRFLPPVVFAVVVAAVFLTALPREFVLDGRLIVADQDYLQPGVPLSRLLTGSYWGEQPLDALYRPLTMLSYWVEKNVLGFEQAWPFAAVNAVLHLGVTLLLWRLSWCWTGSRSAAFITGLLFAAHPIATEIVPNLVGRADLLALGFALLALLAWERGGPGQGRPWSWAAVAGLCMLVGFFSKESVIVMPAVMLLRDLVRFGKAVPWRQWLALAAVGSAALAWRMWVVAGFGPTTGLLDVTNPIAHADLPGQWMTAIGVWARYVRLMFWPQWMSVLYNFNEIPLIDSPLNVWFLSGLILLALALGITIVCWRPRLRRTRLGAAAALGLTMMLLGWFLVSNLVLVIGTNMGDRLMYLPLAGLCIALGAAAAAVGRPRLTITAALLLAVALAWRTHVRCEVWRDQLSLRRSCVRDAPRNATGLLEYAKLIFPDDPQEAMRLIERAGQILEPLDPSLKAAMWTNEAVLYMELAQAAGDKNDPSTWDSAKLARARQLLEYVVSLESQPGPRYERWLHRNRWLENHGRQAPQRYGFWDAHVNLGILEQIQGDHAKAAEQFRIAIQMEPTQASIYDKLARSLSQVGDLPGAVEALEHAVRLQPNLRGDWSALAKARSVLGRHEQALDAADQVLKLKDDQQAGELLLAIYVDWLNAASKAGDQATIQRIIDMAARRHRIRIAPPPAREVVNP